MASKSSLRKKSKGLTRPDRLLVAREWLPTFKGKRIARGYAKWFGVDVGVALTELEMLGVELDPEYVKRVRETLSRPSKKKRRAKQSASDIPAGYGVDWDDNFAFIAGFTSGGAPYGTTWEEHRLLQFEYERAEWLERAKREAKQFRPQSAASQNDAPVRASEEPKQTEELDSEEPCPGLPSRPLDLKTTQRAGRRGKRRPLPKKARMEAARKWLPTFEGNDLDLIQAYAEAFAVPVLCALNDLKRLHVELEPAYVESLREQQKELEADHHCSRPRRHSLGLFRIDWDKELDPFDEVEDEQDDSPEEEMPNYVAWSEGEFEGMRLLDYLEEDSEPRCDLDDATLSELFRAEDELPF